VLEQARAYLSSLGSSVDKRTNVSAEYYVKAMERIVEKGETWLVKEQTR
jgi:protein disulfide-isomerase A6